jgi:hypothetical protein
MQTSEILRNYPCEVHFAGFHSNTLELQKAGWMLSMEQLPHRATLRLAMRHERAGLNALSADISYNVMAYMAQRGGYIDPRALSFEIIWMGAKAYFEIMSTRSLAFHAIDAVPQWESPERIAFEDAIPFRPLNDDAPEIVVPQHSVPELMEMILKLQDPTQKEIRERRRREAFREEARRSIPESYNPAADIKAQIITLAC